MRKIIIASMVVAQIAAMPAAAAGFGEAQASGQREAGAFAGGRIRLPLGGEKRAVSAGLMVAPMVQNQSADGRRRFAFGEGVELGFAGGDKPQLSLAGMRFSHGRLAAAEEGDKDGKRGGPSTLLLVGGGVVLAVGIALALYADALNDASE